MMTAKRDSRRWRESAANEQSSRTNPIRALQKSSLCQKAMARDSNSRKRLVEQRKSGQIPPKHRLLKSDSDTTANGMQQFYCVNSALSPIRVSTKQINITNEQSECGE
jgi:hypothetical protein